MQTVRTFISLNLNEAVKGKLALVQQEVIKELSGHVIKWESFKKFHLTLRYLGDLNSTEIRDLMKELGKIKTDFDNIVYFSDSIGFFPDTKYPNVVFIDLAEKGNNSLKLVNEIDKVISGFSIVPDKKFVPHVTLGRFKRDKRQKLETQIKTEVPKIEIVFEAFTLMKSELKDTGSEYEELKRLNFKNQ